MEGTETFEMAPYVEKASRLELIVRWFYAIVIGVVFYLWAIYISIIEFLQFFHILIFGRRGARLYRSTRRYVAAFAYVSAYLTFLTDARPNLTPDLSILFKRVSLFVPPYVGHPRFCASCGVAIQLNAKFCGSCGAKLD